MKTEFGRRPQRRRIKDKASELNNVEGNTDDENTGRSGQQQQYNSPVRFSTPALLAKPRSAIPRSSRYTENVTVLGFLKCSVLYLWHESICASEEFTILSTG
jgi:hypothetical protein